MDFYIENKKQWLGFDMFTAGLLEFLRYIVEI